MKRLPANRRNQLIAVMIATVAVICIVYFILISPQKAKIDDLIAQTNKETLKLQQYKTAIKQMDSTAKLLADATTKLGTDEADLATGDPYAWTYDTMRRFRTGYHRVDIATIGQPTQSDCELVANFPYKQIRFSITGTAFYHDMGKFIADFENKFPHCRIANLNATPDSSSEKLSFRMDIIALVKPNN